MEQPVANRADDLTETWLTHALRAAGHPLTVSDVSKERIGAGQMGATYRLSLTYEGSGGPPTLIAKIAGDDEALRPRVARGYWAEVGFYTQLAAHLELSTPRCWYGAITADHASFTLLLDDLAPAVHGPQPDSCSAVQAAAALWALVTVHASTWNDSTLHDLDFLRRTDRSTAATVAKVVADATEDFLCHFAGQFDASQTRTLRLACAAAERWLLAARQPFCLTHGDYRLDNLLFDACDGRVTVLDWQTAAIGAPLQDVAFFLATSLEAQQRRTNEQELVHAYHAALVDSGVEGYAFDRCWTDYRLGQLHGPMVAVMGHHFGVAARTETSDAMFLDMARRSLTAVRELGTLELLG